LTSRLLQELFSLEGRVALITGGYRGIGLTFADTYAGAGANVVIAARNLAGCQGMAASIANAHGVRAGAKALDVRDSRSVDRAVAETVQEFGKIDILVNCAGIPGPEKPALEMTDEELDEIMNVDFRGTFLVSRAVARHMVKQKSGRIVNVSSILGKIATRNLLGYCSSKAAVIQLTRVMALELMRENIQVNALCPGYFKTEFNEKFFASEAGEKMIRKMIPLQRAGSLNELQSAALYLATCPPFLTGTELYVDGGHTIV
jgi:NAD(P)-dependent dehydrogenase (short-subunit alcohol dehydrogenase family)